VDREIEGVIAPDVRAADGMVEREREVEERATADRTAIRERSRIDGLSGIDETSS
jgi:hypothetical protein